MGRDLKYRSVKADGLEHIITLGSRVAGGAAGDIHLVSDHQNSAAKIYKGSADLVQYEAKIKSMLATPPVLPPIHFNDIEHHQISWPQTLLYQKDNFVGYSMPKIDLDESVTLVAFLQKRSRERDNLSEHYGHRIQIAYNLSNIVAAIHDMGHCIIDLKPKNCAVNKKNLFVSILDTDGFKIKEKQGVYFEAMQYTPEYIAPECMDERPEDAGQNQDLFSLAVIIFQLFNNGIHPFQAGMKTKQLPIQEMVKRKSYAYALKGPGRLLTPRQSLHEYWPREIRQCFDQAFIGKNRPSASQWSSLLLEHLSPEKGKASACEINNDHLKLNGICPICASQGIQRSTGNSKDNLQSASSVSKNSQTHLLIPPKTSQVPYSGSVSQPVSTQKSFRAIFYRDLIGLSGITWLVATFLFFYLFSSFSTYSEFLAHSFHNYTLTFWATFLIIFYHRYRRLRGNKLLDCMNANCGAYNGYLSLNGKSTQSFGFLHTTNSGKRDKRFKDNPEILGLRTSWECDVCQSIHIHEHDPDTNPTVSTKVIHRTFSLP